ncbi:hypothetical protein GALL_210450 [mine drainage metagenome]|uniref:Uncharacterized protein n=1 Tax=mine drainage metagenome TaxID=410659 RepID=A0A1J5RN35_9ZZZZ
MKPKKSSSFSRLRFRFPPLRLYRPDIEEIIHIAEGGELIVKLSDDSYDFESLDDLIENRGKRIKKLNINLVPKDSAYEYVTIDVDTDGITITATKNEKLALIWHEIKEVIGNKQPWYARFMRPFSWGAGGILLLVLAPKREQIQVGSEWTLHLWVGLMLLCFLMYGLSGLYLFKSKGIYLQREHEIEGFWGRYGEKIVLLVIGTVLGVAGKVIADRLTGK